MIIFLGSTLIVYVVGIMLYLYSSKNHKDVFGDHGYIGNTYVSMAMYYFIAVFTLLIALLVLKPRLEKYISSLRWGKEMVNSGLSFAIMLVIIGVTISYIYCLVYSVSKKIFGNRSIFETLSEAEQRWLMILSCITLVICCLSTSAVTEGMMAVAIILGKFFWMDFRLSDFTDIKVSLLSLPVIFVIIAAIFLVLALGVVLIPKDVNKMVIGLLVGGVFAIITIAFKNNK